MLMIDDNATSDDNDASDRLRSSLEKVGQLDGLGHSPHL